MKKAHLFGILVTALVLAAFAGCNQGSTPGGGTSKGGDTPSSKKEDDEHDHGPGPHKGTIFDFGKWHAEFVVDHKTQEATVYLLSTSGNKPRPITADKLSLTVKNPQFTVELKAVPQDGDPAGKSSRFVGKHENFKKEQEFEGTMNGVVDGTPYVGEFKEEPEKKK
jgi:hypothetical protein